MADGQDGAYSAATPTRASDAQYHYTFAGWSLTPGGSADPNAMKNITADRSVYAAFTTTVRTYTVTWYNGTTLLETDTNVPYGTTPTYNGADPVYNGSGDPADYKWNGWNPAVGPIQGDTKYTAAFKYSGYFYTKLIDRSITSIESDVETIGEYAFYFSPELTTVDLPMATTIGNYAFYNCAKLTTVDFPAVTTIGEHAFNTCSGLTAVSMPIATTIGRYAFRECKKLTTVNFPAVTAIGNSAFAACSGLTAVSFPMVTNIGSVFANCTKLSVVDLPVATSINTQAFRSCSALETVILRSMTVAKLDGTNAFENTPIASGTGYIYVPAALVEEYKEATNWSTYGTQFRAIEDYPDVTGGVTV